MVLFFLGALICAANFYLSYIRYSLFYMTGRQSEFRYVSGIPLVGSLIVVLSLIFLRLPHWATLAGVVLAVLDTGGIHWFIGSVAWHSMRSGSTPKS
jgi:phosphatidylserine synthase